MMSWEIHAGAAWAERDRRADGSGENIGPLKRADALQQDWLSCSLMSITK